MDRTREEAEEQTDLESDARIRAEEGEQTDGMAPGVVSEEDNNEKLYLWMTRCMQ